MTSRPWLPPGKLPLQPVLKWRVCKELAGERCLYLQTGRCLAPCTAASPADQASYDAMLKTLDRLLTGRDAEILHDLEARMKQEAAGLLPADRNPRARSALRVHGGARAARVGNPVHQAA